MTRLLILVEGQTEEVVVKQILAPHLERCGVYIIPTVVYTKHNPSGRDSRGGATSWGKIRKDLLNLMRDKNAWVTALFDFYRLANDFPDLKSLKSQGSAHDKVAALQNRFSQELNHRKFIPFLALHEIEAWLFSDPDIVAGHYEKNGIATELRTMVKKSGGAELLNDTKETSPQARINKIVQKYTKKSYKKTSHGPTILKKIGVERIRTACPHFNAWLERLEALGNGLA